jgi:undecaprenyl-diphosphatase
MKRRKGPDEIIDERVPVLKQRFRKVLRLNVFSFLLFILVIIGYLVKIPLLEMDESINDSIIRLETPFLVDVFTLITYVGNFASLILISLIVIVVLLFKKKWNSLLVYMPSMLSGFIAYPVLKAIFLRPRPEGRLIEVIGTALPSGHAMMTIILFGSLIYCFRRHIGNGILKNLFTAGCIVMFLLVGFSRIYLQVHWTSDVIAGFAVGLFILTLYILVFDHLLSWTKIRSSEMGK